MFKIDFMTIRIMDIKKDVIFTIKYVTIQQVGQNIFAMRTLCRQYQTVLVIFWAKQFARTIQLLWPMAAVCGVNTITVSIQIKETMDLSSLLLNSTKLMLFVSQARSVHLQFLNKANLVAILTYAIIQLGLGISNSQ